MAELSEADAALPDLAKRWRERDATAAYIASPEGEGEDTCRLMTRLAACVAPWQSGKGWYHKTQRPMR